MSTNRREFLQRSGGLALTGLIGGSGIAAAATQAVSDKPQAPCKAAASLEGWLLETGRRDLPDDVYHAVSDGKC
jgi:hypothetical protein